MDLISGMHGLFISGMNDFSFVWPDCLTFVSIVFLFSKEEGFFMDFFTFNIYLTMFFFRIANFFQPSLTTLPFDVTG